MGERREEAKPFDRTETAVTSDRNAPTREAFELPQIDSRLYEIRREVARGGLGCIVEALDRRLARTVALKLPLVSNDAALRRFAREAVITARLQHPAIVPVHEAGCFSDGRPFYAMKLVEGARSLADAIAERKTLQERLALLPTVIAVADAIAYAHSQRVIHRDLKPSNILVGPFGETVVIDWGLAKDLRASEDDQPHSSNVGSPEMTRAGDVLGTPAYMPPEQARGEPVDERADVYALGAILYHVTCGDPPFDGRTSDEVLRRVICETLTPVEHRQPGAPAELAAIVARSMAVDPMLRYPSARELVEDLRRFQAGQLVGAHAYSPAQILRRWFAAHRGMVALVAATVLAAIAALVVGNVLRDVQHRQLEDRARGLARNLANASLYGLITGDTNLLDPELQNMGNEADIDQACVLNREGVVVASTDKSQVGGTLPDAAFALEADAVAIDKTRGDRWIVVAPVRRRGEGTSASGEKRGAIRMIVGLTRVNAERRRTELFSVGLAIPLALLVIFGAYGLVRPVRPRTS